MLIGAYHLKRSRIHENSITPCRCTRFHQCFRLIWILAPGVSELTGLLTSFSQPMWSLFLCNSQDQDQLVGRTHWKKKQKKTEKRYLKVVSKIRHFKAKYLGWKHGLKIALFFHPSCPRIIKELRICIAFDGSRCKMRNVFKNMYKKINKRECFQVEKRINRSVRKHRYASSYSLNPHRLKFPHKRFTYKHAKHL